RPSERTLPQEPADWQGKGRSGLINIIVPGGDPRSELPGSTTAPRNPGAGTGSWLIHPGGRNGIVADTPVDQDHLEDAMSPTLIPQPGGPMPRTARLPRRLDLTSPVGGLVRRTTGATRCKIECRFDDPKLDLDFSIKTTNRFVSVGGVPAKWLAKAPVFLPTRELLTIYPNFVSV